MKRSLKAFGAVKICSCSMPSASWCRCSAVLALTMLQLWLKDGRGARKEIGVRQQKQRCRQSASTSSPTSFRSSTTRWGPARGCSVAPSRWVPRWPVRWWRHFSFWSAWVWARALCTCCPRPGPWPSSSAGTGQPASWWLRGRRWSAGFLPVWSTQLWKRWALEFSAHFGKSTPEMMRDAMLM